MLYRKEAILVIIERDCTSEINGRCEGGSNKKKRNRKTERGCNFQHNSHSVGGEAVGKLQVFATKV